MTSCHLKTKKEVCQDYLNARRRAAGIIYLPPLKTVLFHLSLSINVFIYSFTLCPVDAAFFFISSFLPLGTVKFILSYFYILVLVRYLVKSSAFSFHRFLPLEILLSSCYDNKNTWGQVAGIVSVFCPLVLSLCIFALLIK